MKKILIFIILILIIIFTIYINLGSTKDGDEVISYKNAEYLIEGKKIKLVEGVGQTDTDPKMIVKYFGNDLHTDLNNDGLDDVVFLVTVQSGGTGTFYYALAALTPKNEHDLYMGSDGYFLGDRISPQNIELSKNLKHKNVIVVNYADRQTSEPISTAPSLAKSAYLKLDYSDMHWGIVEPNFEGEAR